MRQLICFFVGALGGFLGVLVVIVEPEFGNPQYQHGLVGTAILLATYVETSNNRSWYESTLIISGGAIGSAFCWL